MRDNPNFNGKELELQKSHSLFSKVHNEHQELVESKLDTSISGRWRIFCYIKLNKDTKGQISSEENSETEGFLCYTAVPKDRKGDSYFNQFGST